MKPITCMKFLLLPSFMLLFLSATGQYYYNDIVGTLETNQQMKSFTANKVKMVSSAGYDANGVKATDYAEVSEVKENGRALKISSRNNNNYTAYYNRFDEQGRLISITDSSTAVQSVTSYYYDAVGRIIKVQNVVKDSANDFDQTEVHQYYYNDKGFPGKMWRTINNSDSLEIRFTPDDKGNPGDEKTYRRGVETGTVYYYYDDKHRLTDVVRYNTKYKKLLPDLMFEYDDQDHVIQKITTTSSLHIGYLIWRYIFGANGLKTKEALFDDQKQLTGKIEYTYLYF
jgi:YD repeat-containing protein